jgi:hypothetical protein
MSGRVERANGRTILLRPRRVRSFDAVDRPPRRRNPSAQWSRAPLRRAFERVVVRRAGSPGCCRTQVFPVRIARPSDAQGLDRWQPKLPRKRPPIANVFVGGRRLGGAMPIAIDARCVGRSGVARNRCRRGRRAPPPIVSSNTRATARVIPMRSKSISTRSGGKTTSQRALRICAMCNTLSVTDCPNAGCGRAWATQSSAHQRRA